MCKINQRRRQKQCIKWMWRDSGGSGILWWRRPRARATTSRVLPQGRAAARTTPRPDCRDKAQDSYPGWGGYRDKTESTCWGAGARGWSHRGAVGWKGVWVWTWGHWGEERKGGASRKRAQPGGGRSRQAAFRGRTGGMRRRRVPRRPNPGVRWSPLWWLTALRVAEASRWALSTLEVQWISQLRGWPVALEGKARPSPATTS